MVVGGGCDHYSRYNVEAAERQVDQGAGGRAAGVGECGLCQLRGGTMIDTSKVDRLLDVVRRPTLKRKPSNFALYWAWLFYNLVALLFDVIAASTVYEMTGKAAYAALTFAAGFLPLFMHEFLFTRAYASGLQKTLAVIGACLSVITIVAVGVLAGLVNVLGFAGDSVMLEIAMILTLVGVAAAHGLIAAVYFYVDEGIKAKQVRAESMAYHERRLEDIGRAKEILALADLGAREEDGLAAQYGGASVVNEVLAQLRGVGGGIGERGEEGGERGELGVERGEERGERGELEGLQVSRLEGGIGDSGKLRVESGKLEGSKVPAPVRARPVVKPAVSQQESDDDYVPTYHPDPRLVKKDTLPFPKNGGGES